MTIQTESTTNNNNSSGTSNTKCAITVISHDTTLSLSTTTKFEQYLTETLQIPVFTVRKLSNRASDYFVEIPNIHTLRTQIKQYVNTHSSDDNDDDNGHFDMIVQRADSRRDAVNLVVFDMDSTLIYQEVIELIASYADIEAQVADITTRAMNGELDFNQSLAQRVQLLSGIDSTHIWEELKHKIILTKGVKELCQGLKRLGVVLAVLSGGFIPLAEYVKGELGLDYAFANTLGVDEQNRLDGTTVGPIVNGEKKAELLLEIAKQNGIDPRNAIAVGDGANDLKMMGVAGFGIAWNAKPKVQLEAPGCLNSDSLKDVLYILGYSDEEIANLLK